MGEKEITLGEFIKTREFEDFQLDAMLWDEDFRNYKDELFGEGDKFDSIGELEDVFLFQKRLYEDLGVYFVFPIIGKFIYEKATEADCNWCWDSKRDLDSRVVEKFEKYLYDLITKWQDSKKQNNE